VQVQLTAMDVQLRAPEPLRRSSIAPQAQPRPVQTRNLVSPGRAFEVTAWLTSFEKSGAVLAEKLHREGNVKSSTLEGQLFQEPYPTTHS
jgi:hypothetical protein